MRLVLEHTFCAGVFFFLMLNAYIFTHSFMHYVHYVNDYVLVYK